MEIKNEALRSLYEDLVSDIWSFSIEAAFKKCDDELEKEKLMTDNDNAALQHTVDDFVVKCKDLQSAYDKEHGRWVELAENYDRLETKYRRLERDHNAKTDNGLAYDRIKQLEELNDALEKAINELKKQNKTLAEKCRAETKVREYYWRQLCNERGERICRLMREKEDLKQQLDTLKHKDAVFVDLDSSKLNGMEELWSMLGEMYAADPIEVSKIFGWFSINNNAHYTPDVKVFLEKFKIWKSGKEEKEEEQKRLDGMRDYLHKFCQGHICLGCPLESKEFKCGHIDFFSEMIPDKELKRYYEKAVEEEKPSDEVPCSFGWKLDGTEFSIETSIPRKDYDNIVKIISGKE